MEKYKNLKITGIVTAVIIFILTIVYFSFPNGDINMDYKVNKTDVKLVLGYIVENNDLNSVQLKRADMNNDGEITVGDATLICNIIKK